MAKVEMEFRSFSSRHDASPGDRKKIDEADVPSLVSDGIAVPVTQAEAKKAGVSPSEAATAK